MNSETFEEFESAFLLPFRDQPEEEATATNEATEETEGTGNEQTQAALNELFGEDEDLGPSVQLDKKLSLQIIALARILDTLQQKLTRLISNDTKYIRHLSLLSTIRSDYAFFLRNLDLYEPDKIKQIVKKFEQITQDLLEQLK